MKLPGPRAFQSVMMIVVVVVVAPFFAVIDATSGWSKLSGSPSCSNSLLESSDVLVGSSDGHGRSSKSIARELGRVRRVVVVVGAR
jgi:hypothetical protein